MAALESSNFYCEDNKDCTSYMLQNGKFKMYFTDETEVQKLIYVPPANNVSILSCKNSYG